MRANLLLFFYSLNLIALSNSCSIDGHLDSYWFSYLDQHFLIQAESLQYDSITRFTNPSHPNQLVTCLIPTPDEKDVIKTSYSQNFNRSIMLVSSQNNLRQVKWSWFCWQNCLELDHEHIYGPSGPKGFGQPMIGHQEYLDNLAWAVQRRSSNGGFHELLFTIRLFCWLCLVEIFDLLYPFSSFGSEWESYVRSKFSIETDNHNRLNYNLSYLQWFDLICSDSHNLNWSIKTFIHDLIISSSFYDKPNLNWKINAQISTIRSIFSSTVSDSALCTSRGPRDTIFWMANYRLFKCIDG